MQETKQSPALLNRKSSYIRIFSVFTGNQVKCFGNSSENAETYSAILTFRNRLFWFPVEKPVESVNNFLHTVSIFDYSNPIDGLRTDGF